VLHENRELTKGSAIFADSRLYMLCEDGWMLLQEPRSTAFEEKGRFRMAAPRDRDAWAHPVIHDGRLYLRYHDTLMCYDIRAAPGT
jgi:outer membrane protein assembly factor BamB